ncbi:MBL fold metallo-hydrolase, partial [Candidatus Woesearchaeota archaeon]|nr:MBL fold metallo-hydrolase [Candidatus Woesearchaeota archaeon]
MQITFMGTSSMVPTKERNQIGVFVRTGSEGILIDCGEGIQRQFKIAGVSLTEITKILISHWHGDHVLGLPGLIQTLSSSDYSGTLEIYGPKETRKRFVSMFRTFVFDRKIDLKIHEIKKQVFFENDNLKLEAYKLEHGIATLGYNVVEKGKRKMKMEAVKKLNIPIGPMLGKLQDGKSIVIDGKKITPDMTTYVENGKKLSFITDTSLCDNCHKLATDADLLICEATYSSKL